MSRKRQSFWEVFGKLSAVLAVLGTLVTTYSFLTAKPDADLSVLVLPNKFHYPPNIEDKLKNFHRRLSSYELLDSMNEDWLTKKGIGKREAQILAEHISSQLEQSWPQEIANGTLETYYGYSDIFVANNGGAEAINTVLEIPLDGVYFLQHEGANETVGPLRGSINIGNVRQGTRAVLRIWSSSRLKESQYEEVRATHQTGIGTVEIGTPVFGFWHAAYHYVNFWKVWMALIGFWLVTLIPSIWSYFQEK